MLLLLGLLWLAQRRLIHLPGLGPVPPAGTVLPGARDVSFTTRDGLRLSAWYVPPCWPTRSRPASPRASPRWASTRPRRPRAAAAR